MPKASHIKDKIIEMIHLNETMYSCGIACSAEGTKTASGNYLINLLLANVCKQNVTRFPYEMARLAQDLGLAEEEVHGIRLAAAIHDIGKIHVPAEILSYPGRLPEIEFALIKAHPRIGYDILKNVDFPWPVAEMVYQHHEHLDGSGYPRGLKGDAIMLGARIITVADVVEAIDLYRPYRPGLGIDAALGEITTHRGRFYDERVVDCCLSLFREQGFGFAETTDPDIWRVKS